MKTKKEKKYPIYKSSCCGVGVSVGGQSETHYYVCNKCNKACDFIIPKPEKKVKKIGYSDKFIKEEQALEKMFFGGTTEKMSEKKVRIEEISEYDYPENLANRIDNEETYKGFKLGKKPLERVMLDKINEIIKVINSK